MKEADEVRKQYPKGKRIKYVFSHEHLVGYIVGYDNAGKPVLEEDTHGSLMVLNGSRWEPYRG